MNVKVHKIGRNTFSILTSDVINRATTFVLYALVARHMGGGEFGQLSLALTFFYISQVFALGGMKTLIIREVAKDRDSTGAYFINGCGIVAAFSLTAIAAQWGFIRLMHYTAATSHFIMLLSLGLVPYTVSGICEAIFQAWERMHYVAYVNTPVNIAKLGAAFLLLTKNSSLDTIVLILLCSLTAGVALELWLIMRRFPALHGSFDFRFCLATARCGFTFLGIDGIVAVLCGLNFLFLSKTTNEVQVGLYNATTQVVAPFLLVYQSIARSIFPIMCRKSDPSFRSLKKIAEQAIEALLILAVPAVAAIYFLGGRALLLLYQNPVFAQAFPALRIVSGILILQVFTTVLGQVLVASHRESATLRIVAVDTLANLIVGWPLIHWFGLAGAAVALLVTALVDFSQHYIRVSRLFSGFPLAKVGWKPLLGTTFMVIFLAASSNPTAIFTVVSAGFIYSAVLLALAIAACGGYREFKNRYRPLLSG